MKVNLRTSGIDITHANEHNRTIKTCERTVTGRIAVEIRQRFRGIFVRVLFSERKSEVIRISVSLSILIIMYITNEEKV